MDKNGKRKNWKYVERNGKIYARVRFKDENGKTRDFWRVAESKVEAKKKIKKLLKEVENLSAKELDSANMTVAELAEYYRKNNLHQAFYKEPQLVLAKDALRT